MRTLHSFLYLGGSFVLLICTVGIFIFPENAIDGLIYVSFCSFLPSTLAMFIFPIKKMIAGEIPDKDFIDLFNEKIDIGKWTSEKVKNEKERLCIPYIFWIGYISIIATFKIDWQEASFIKTLPLILAALAVYKIITIIVDSPKLKLIS